ncbi:MAG: hypothetical protein ABSA18_18025 [Dehalococcoidia bacterium]|jgi:hypothetical protein
MKLIRLLQLQIVYGILGIGYNGISFFLTAMGKQPLASTSPVLGFISMLVYGLFLVSGFLRKIVLYRILMIVSVIVLGYGGVVQHIINIFVQPQIYSSLIAWAVAVIINLFGLGLNIVAALGKFKQ